MSDNIKPEAIELSEQQLDEVAGGLAIANASDGSVAEANAFNGGFAEADAEYYGDARANASNGSRAIATDVGSGYYPKHW